MPTDSLRIFSASTPALGMNPTMTDGKYRSASMTSFRSTTGGLRSSFGTGAANADAEPQSIARASRCRIGTPKVGRELVPRP